MVVVSKSLAATFAAAVGFGGFAADSAGLSSFCAHGGMLQTISIGTCGHGGMLQLVTFSIGTGCCAWAVRRETAASAGSGKADHFGTVAFGAPTRLTACSNIRAYE